MFDSKLINLKIPGMASNSLPHKHPRLDLQMHYNARLRKWIRSATVQEIQIVKSHGFGNALSLAEVEMDWWLLESLIDKWDPRSRVFRFGTIEMCPTLEEYAALLGVPCDVDLIVSPSTALGFKQRLSKTLGIKKKFLTQGNTMYEYRNIPLGQLCDLFATTDAFESRTSSFLVSQDEWTQRRIKALELSVLGHILFPKARTLVDAGLLEFRDQIEQGHSFIPALLADTFRALNMAKRTRTKNLECCVALLQIWFLEHISLFRPVATTGILKEDLIKEHDGKSSREHFKQRNDWIEFLDNMKVDMIIWKPSWLHVEKVLMFGLKSSLLLLTGFRGIEGYSSSRVVRQFGWVQSVPVVPNFEASSLELTVANRKTALESWRCRQKVEVTTVTANGVLLKYSVCLEKTSDVNAGPLSIPVVPEYVQNSDQLLIRTQHDNEASGKKEDAFCHEVKYPRKENKGQKRKIQEQEEIIQGQKRKIQEQEEIIRALQSEVQNLKNSLTQTSLNFGPATLDSIKCAEERDPPVARLQQMQERANY